MRQSFVHQALLRLAEGADDRAPGAAVTVALCGSWEHDGPCHWPHHTSVEQRDEAAITVRTVFATEPADEVPVRQLIAAALFAGALQGPDRHSRWTLLTGGPAELSASEQDLAERLTSC